MPHRSGAVRAAHTAQRASPACPMQGLALPQPRAAARRRGPPRWPSHTQRAISKSSSQAAPPRRRSAASPQTPATSRCGSRARPRLLRSRGRQTCRQRPSLELTPARGRPPAHLRHLRGALPAAKARDAARMQLLLLGPVARGRLQVRSTGCHFRQHWPTPPSRVPRPRRCDNGRGAPSRGFARRTRPPSGSAGRPAAAAQTGRPFARARRTRARPAQGWKSPQSPLIRPPSEG
mmetsp:Transcript_1340/g.5339  ORF Transcript_1340/g.5339 Transcript_1340/m.5339 type:complete len:234 (-) Transcript_1340:327-1028(-)